VKQNLQEKDSAHGYTTEARVGGAQATRIKGIEYRVEYAVVMGRYWLGNRYSLQVGRLR